MAGGVGVRSAGRGRPQARRRTRVRIARGERSPRRGRHACHLERAGLGDLYYGRGKGCVGHPYANGPRLHRAVRVLMPMLGGRDGAKCIRRRLRVISPMVSAMVSRVLVLAVVRYSVRERLARMGEDGDCQQGGGNEPREGSGAHCLTLAQGGTPRNAIVAVVTRSRRSLRGRPDAVAHAIPSDTAVPMETQAGVGFTDRGRRTVNNVPVSADELT